MKKIIALLFIVALLATVSQAVVIDTFVNADFDSGAVSNPFDGFDAPSSPEIIGWTNYPAGALNDSGVEASTGWWNGGGSNAAFMSPNDAAYNLSSYVIKAGDAFSVSFLGKGWGAAGQWTISFFYDNPANVIGSFTVTPGNWSWIALSSATPIMSTAPSVGGTLGILFKSTGTNFACLDEMIVDVVALHVVNDSPANGAVNIPVARTSPANDLLFTVYKASINKVDVQFGTENDPNLTSKPAYKIVADMAVTPGQQYTVNLESLAADLSYVKTYYWKVIGYEPNALAPSGFDLVPGPVSSFTTKPQDATPVVDAGDSVITTLALTSSPNVLTLHGSVADDGISPLTVKWEAYDVAFGGGLTTKVTFANQTDPNTTVTISESGTYVLSLSATDATGTVSDTKEIVVYDSGCDAAKATGTRVANYYDRDDNCVVNLLDFAVLALEWLDSTGLTESYLNSATVTAGTDNALVAEYWTGVSGTDPNNLLADSRYPASPSGSYLVVGQLSGSLAGDTYGQRIRGYIVPQTSGTYTFYIASDDGSRLFLSADTTPVDTNPALGNQIAEVPNGNWTDANQWTKFPEQKSAPVALTAGQYYYVEILHKENTGGENVSVGWSTDGGTTITVVPGAVLRYGL